MRKAKCFLIVALLHSMALTAAASVECEPKLIGNWFDHGAQMVRAIEVDDGIMYVTSTWLSTEHPFCGGLLFLVDVSDPATPRTITYVPVGCYADVHVVDELGYVTSHQGFMIIDVSDPAQPEMLGEFTEAPESWGLHVVDGNAYVTHESTLTILDISDPADPAVLSTHTLAQPALGLLVLEDVAYVGRGGSVGGIEIVDVSNPTAPAFAGHLAGGFAQRIQGTDGLLYVLENSASLMIYSLADPLNPELLGSWDTSTSYDFHLVGELLYLPIYDCGPDEDGLEILDVSDPTKPVLAGTFQTSGCPHAVAATESLAWLAMEGPGFDVLLTNCSGLGDLDGDGDVDFDDFSQLLASWGDPGCGGSSPCPADIDDDGDVDFDDFTTLLAHWS